MKILSVKLFDDNYSYIIIKDGASIIIDPGEAKSIALALEEHKLPHPKAYIVTHHHKDHCGGVEELQKSYPAALYAPADKRINSPTFMLDSEEAFMIGDIVIKPLLTPGHTSTHISIYLPQEGAVFTGDTLFSAGCGRMFEGTPKQFVASLKKLASLPLDTKIYAGHEYTFDNLHFANSVEPDNGDITSYMKQVEREKNTMPSSLEKELKINPFLRLDCKSVASYCNSSTGDPEEIFAILRALKDKKG